MNFTIHPTGRYNLKEWGVDWPVWTYEFRNDKRQKNGTYLVEFYLFKISLN